MTPYKRRGLVGPFKEEGPDGPLKIGGGLVGSLKIEGACWAS